MPTGEDIREEVQVSAVFLKLWAYKIRAKSASDQQPNSSPQTRRPTLISPLLIGYEPKWIRRDATQPTYTGLIFGIFFVALIAAGWLAVWRFGRRDNRLERSRPPATLAFPDEDTRK